jgi:hypothetical protein
MAEERGLTLDVAGFNEKMEEDKAKSAAAEVFNIYTLHRSLSLIHHKLYSTIACYCSC